MFSTMYDTFTVNRLFTFCKLFLALFFSFNTQNIYAMSSCKDLFSHTSESLLFNQFNEGLGWSRNKIEALYMQGSPKIKRDLRDIFTLPSLEKMIEELNKLELSYLSSQNSKDIDTIKEIVISIELSHIGQLATKFKTFPSEDTQTFNYIVSVGRNLTKNAIQQGLITRENISISLGLQTTDPALQDLSLLNNFSYALTYLHSKPVLRYSDWPKSGVFSELDIQPTYWRNTFQKLISEMVNMGNSKDRIFFNLTGLSKSKIQMRGITWYELSLIIDQNVPVTFYHEGKIVDREFAIQIYEGHVDG